MTCEFNQDGNCLISSTLAKFEVPIVKDVCEACMKQDMPKGINPVTCSRAIFVQEEHLGKGKGANELHRCATQPEFGVGSELEVLFSSFQKISRWFLLGFLFNVDKKKCGCNGLKYNLNSIGYITAKERKAEYVELIVDNYLKSFWYMQLTKPILSVIVSSFYDKALSRHKKKLGPTNVCTPTQVSH